MTANIKTRGEGLRKRGEMTEIKEEWTEAVSAVMRRVLWCEEDILEAVAPLIRADALREVMAIYEITGGDISIYRNPGVFMFGNPIFRDIAQGCA